MTTSPIQFPAAPPACSYPSRDEWLGARSTMIGASESAAIFGVGYAGASPLTVWREKIGESAPEIEPATLRRMALGSQMEPIIGRLWSEETGRQLLTPAPWTIWRHPEHLWLGATLDGVTIDDDRGPLPVELKHVSGRFWRDWEDDKEPPLKYVVQVQHQLAVTGAPAGYLVALVGGEDLVSRLIERDERFISQALMPRLAEFWGRVMAREMPPLDESEATAAALAAHWPRDTGETVQLPPEADQWDRDLLALKERQKVLEADRRKLESQIKAAIGEASIGQLSGGGAWTWKLQQRAAYTVAAGEFRVLRRAKGGD